MKLVQLTDLHLFADTASERHGVNTHESLLQVLAAVEQLGLQPTDALVLSGDCSQDELLPAYQRLAQLLSDVPCPIIWVPGNHDNTDFMQQAFVASPFISEKKHRLGQWLVVVLDTQLLGRVPGGLSAEQLSDLDGVLSNHAEQPTLIVMHHPAVSVGAEWLDNIGLQDKDAFFEVIDRHLQLKLVLAGHVHMETLAQRKGVHYYTTPSTCAQFQPNVPIAVIDQGAHPGFRYTELFDDGSWQTEVIRVPIQ